MGLLPILKQSTVIHLMFAITFFTSGLIINLFQCLLYFGLRPFSRYFYRKINYYLCYSFYSRKLIFLYSLFNSYILGRLTISLILFLNFNQRFTLNI